MYIMLCNVMNANTKIFMNNFIAMTNTFNLNIIIHDTISISYRAGPPGFL